MTLKTRQIQMRVSEAMQRDVGKRRARMGPVAMDSLHVASGDIVEMIGSRTSCAIVWPVDEDEKTPDIIRIDGQTRKNVGVPLNGTVSVRRATTKSARLVTLLPTDTSTTIDGEFTSFLKGRLTGIPLMSGDEVSVKILGNSVIFKISKCIPNGAVLVSDSTNLVISTETAIDRRSQITYEEVGGLRPVIRSMREIVELPLRHPELFSRLGVEAHSGVLLYGPPGCGKTLLAKVLASESDANIYSISGPEIINKYYGETEARLRDMFAEAKENAPSIIFIDEIDSIAPKRDESYGDVEKRVVAQLLALMDGMDERGHVIVLGATNRPDSMEPALRRPGRFDREFEVPVPNTDGRLEILQIHTRGMPLANDVDFPSLASELHGYTGADIESLCREAAIRAIRRYLPMIDLDSDTIPADVLKSMEIRILDFHQAMHEVVPTAMREFYVERPKVYWNDVGGLKSIKKSLTDNLVVSMLEPAKFTKMGIRPPRGALLYGPPGCGKTLVSRALATESGANMILVHGPEILSKWQGESEKAVREIFRKAKASSPCVVIFDELDSVARQRSVEGRPGETILSQLLTELEDRTSPGIAVIGITNRPDMLDASMMRSGRLDLLLYVPPPDKESRKEIVEILLKKMPVNPDIDIAEIVASTQNYTGSDLVSLCREAAVCAMRSNQDKITKADFDKSLRRSRPSITKDVMQWYTRMGEELSSAMPKKTSRLLYG